MGWSALLFALSAGLLLGSDGAKEGAVQQELAKLRGTWARVAVERDGKKLPDEEVRKQRLTIEGDRYTLKMGDETRRGTLRLDPSKTPKTIDIISAEGPNKGKSLLGIYELDGDTFRYCIAAPDKDRPTEFSSRSGQSLFVNRREKP